MAKQNESEAGDDTTPIVGPMRHWERLVLELYQLVEDRDNDTSVRRRAIRDELLDLHRRYREESPQFFHGSNWECDDERDAAHDDDASETGQGLARGRVPERAGDDRER